MPSYAQLSQQHLAEYKRARLGIEEDGIFVHKGKEIRYGHILPKHLCWLNILEPIRTEVREYLAQRPQIKPHRFFHHLNSSQAFALNLFFPYFEQDASEVLLRAMSLERGVSSWQPEHIVDNVEGTNVDVMWQSASGRTTFCEVKLTEQEFGVAKNDGRHCRKLEKIYRPVLTGLCPEDCLEPEAFFRRYQLLRNVWLAAREPSATVVFLLPRANSALWSELGPFIDKLEPRLARRVRAVAIEDVLGKLTSARRAPARLFWYAQLLKEKYALGADRGMR